MGRISRIAVTSCKAVDTTGAGDSWAGGFFYGLSRNYGMAECGRIASAVSAAVVQVQGAKLSQNVWDDLRKKYL